MSEQRGGQYILKLNQSDIALVLLHLEATGEAIDRKLMNKIQRQSDKQGFQEETLEKMRLTEPMEKDPELDKYRQEAV